MTRVTVHLPLDERQDSRGGGIGCDDGLDEHGAPRERCGRTLGEEGGRGEGSDKRYMYDIVLLYMMYRPTLACDVR